MADTDYIGYQDTSGNLTSITEIMTQLVDPVTRDMFDRATRLGKWIKMNTRPWSNNELKYKVGVQSLQATRPRGRQTPNTALPDPIHAPTWDSVILTEQNMFDFICPVRYSFRAQQMPSDAEIANVAGMLGTQSVEDMAETVDIYSMTNRWGVLGIVNTCLDEGGSSPSSETTLVITLKANSILPAFRPGVQLHFIVGGVTYPAKFDLTTGSINNSTPGTAFGAVGTRVGVGTVQKVEFNEGSSSGVYGTITISVGTSGDLDNVVADAYILHTDAVNDGICGFDHWMIPTVTGATGAWKNNELTSDSDAFLDNAGNTIDRDTAATYWWTPVFYDGSNSAIDLAKLTALAVQTTYSRRAGDEMPVVLGSPWMVHELAKAVEARGGYRTTQTAEGTAEALKAKYGFSGFVYQAVGQGAPVTVLDCSLLQSDRILGIVPGEFEYVAPAPIEWIPRSNVMGHKWEQEHNSSGQPTMRYRADRIMTLQMMMKRGQKNFAYGFTKPV